MNTRKVALTGLLSAQALTLSFAEGLLPLMPFLPPGAKPGLSNVVTMFAVMTAGLPQAMTITLIKALFALVTRGVTAFCMSLAGGVLSTFAAWLLIKFLKDKIGILGISVISALCHNAGQLAVAVCFTGTRAVLGYAPVLLVFSLIAGVLSGVVLRILMPALEKQSRYITKGVK